MAYGIEKLYEEHAPVRWQGGAGAPGWASGYAFGKGAVEDYQRGVADTEAGEANAAGGLQTENVSGKDAIKHFRENYEKQDLPSGAPANADAYLAANPEFAKGLEGIADRKASWSMGSKTQDTEFTPSQRERAGLEEEAKFWAGSKAPGARAKAAAARAGMRELGLHEMQLTAAQDAINRGRVADSDKAAYSAAIKALPEVGSYTLDGKVVPKGTEGAKEVTHFDYANGMRLAAAAGGDHAAAGVWGEKAGLHLANQTAMRVMKATSLDDINKGAYGDFANGKDFVETKNKDGSVSYGHKGEPPVFTASKFDQNPFATFKESLATTALKDPKATLDFHDKTRAMNMRGQELSATLDLKKAIAGQTAQAHAAGNEVRRLVAQGAVDARNDAIEARRGQFMAQAMEKWGAANEPPTADPKTKEGRTTIAAWEKKRDDHLGKLMSNYDAGVAGKAPQRGAKPVNLSPPALDEPTGGLEVSSLDRAVKSQTGWGSLTPEAMLQRGVQLGVPGAIAEAEARELRLQPNAGMPLGDPNYVPG